MLFFSSCLFSTAGLKWKKGKRLMCLHTAHANLKKAWSLHFVCMLNLAKLELMCWCYHVHKCMREPHFLLKAVVFPGVGLWLCGMADWGLAPDWGASQRASSQLGKERWWSAVHRGKVNTSFPLPTPPARPGCWEKSQSCSQHEAWKHHAAPRPKTTDRAKQVENLWAFFAVLASGLDSVQVQTACHVVLCCSEDVWWNQMENSSKKDPFKVFFGSGLS